MNFCAIGPMCLQNLFEDHSHHMALAQYMEDKSYKEFYKELIKQGKTVVLDSGVYENAAVGNKELLMLCEELSPYAVILPDRPHDHAETLRLSGIFAMQLIENSIFTFQWKVLHAPKNDLSIFTACYNYDKGHFDGVCFSRLTESYGLLPSGKPMTRPDFVEYLQSFGLWNVEGDHHALGMKDGSLVELTHLASLGLTSIDSSAPLWRGLNGQTLPAKPEPFHIPFNPFADPANFRADYTQLAYTNFKETLSLCHA